MPHHDFSFERTVFVFVVLKGRSKIRNAEYIIVKCVWSIVHTKEQRAVQAKTSFFRESEFNIRGCVLPGFCSKCRSYIPAGRTKCPKCHPLDGILTTRRSSKKYLRHGYLGRKGSNIELSLGGDRDLAAEFAARRRELEKRLRK